MEQELKEIVRLAESYWFEDEPFKAYENVVEENIILVPRKAQNVRFTGGRININNLTNEQFVTYFCFEKVDLPWLVKCLGIPEFIKLYIGRRHDADKFWSS